MINGQLNLNTGTLAASSLNNTYTSKSTFIEVNIGGSVQKNDVNNVSLDYANDKTNRKTKTLASLGFGNINIAITEDSGIKMLNTDVANNEVDIYKYL